MTPAKMQACTRKELAERAKRRRVPGWHGMKKDELVEALLAIRPARKIRSVKRNGRTGSTRTNARQTTKPKPAAEGRSRSRHGRVKGNGRVTSNGVSANGRNRSKSRSRGASRSQTNRSRTHRNGRTERPRLKQTGHLNGETKERLVAEVCDPCWLLVRWILNRATLDRAEAALGVEWHQAIPVIRVFDVTTDDLGTSAKTWVRDVEIHGEVDHWYVPVNDPPRSFRLQVGYRTPSGNFFALAHSNKVRTRNRGASEDVAKSDTNGDCESARSRQKTTTLAPYRMIGSKIASIPRSAGSYTHQKGGSHGNGKDVEFRVETELIIYGTANPHGTLTLLGDPVTLNKDGTFSLRYQLPNGRQVIPAVSVTPNGSEQHTIILGIERNTKVMEPRNLDE